MQANVLDFCRARETLRKAMERTQAERNDANELKRSVQGQVCEMCASGRWSASRCRTWRAAGSSA